MSIRRRAALALALLAALAGAGAGVVELSAAPDTSASGIAGSVTAPTPSPRPSDSPTAPTPAVASATAVPTAVATPGPATTVTGTIVVDYRLRTWSQVTPASVGPSTPILLVLHGRSVTPETEEQRDGLLTLPTLGVAELVYPAGIGQSWNAGGCCGDAAAQNVDDLHFLRMLVAQVDAARARPIYLVGYSNGGRMTNTVACDDPGLFDGFAVVGALPVRTCLPPAPISLLQIAGTADPEVAFQGAQSVTSEVSSIVQLDGCAGPPAMQQTGGLSLTAWTGCSNRVRVALAAYAGADHSWPAGTPTTPSAATVIWNFVAAGAQSPRSVRPTAS